MSDTTSELRQAIHEAVAETIQVERIGRATDPKPADRIWFTTQMQDMFAVSTDYLEERLLALLAAQKQRWQAEARKDELVTAAPHFCDEPTNFVYYNNRIAALDGVIGENK